MDTIKKHLPTAARLLLGLAFFVFGLNGFLNFLPAPSGDMSEAATAFMGGLVAAGYMFPLIKGVELFAGLLLLANRFVPLALALLAPVLVNIVAYHVFLMPEGTGVGVFLTSLTVYLAWAYRHAFAPMLASKVAPAGHATTDANASLRPETQRV